VITFKAEEDINIDAMFAERHALETDMQETDIPLPDIVKN